MHRFAVCVRVWPSKQMKACARIHVCTRLCVCAWCAHRALTTEMLASPMAGVAPALHTTSWPWHTLMEAMRLEGRVAAFTSLSPLPHAAAATSQKKAKQTVMQKSCRDEAPGSAPSLACTGCGAGSGPGAQPPYHEGELLVLAVEGMKAQVEHQSRHGVEEREDPQGHEKFGGSGEVTDEVQGPGLRFALTVRHLKGDLV